MLINLFCRKYAKCFEASSGPYRVRIKRGYGCGMERIDGTDMSIKRGADMRIKRGADMRIKRGWVVFLCELSLNLFRKEVMVLDKTEFAAMFQLI